MNLHELAVKAQKEVSENRVLARGITLATEWLSDSGDYHGTNRECAQYLNQKIMIATVNAIENRDYLGCIALYSKMIELLLLEKETD